MANQIPVNKDQQQITIRNDAYDSCMYNDSYNLIIADIIKILDDYLDKYTAISNNIRFNAQSMTELDTSYDNFIMELLDEFKDMLYLQAKMNSITPLCSLF